MSAHSPSINMRRGPRPRLQLRSYKIWQFSRQKLIREIHASVVLPVDPHRCFFRDQFVLSDKWRRFLAGSGDDTRINYVCVRNDLQRVCDEIEIERRKSIARLRNYGIDPLLK